MDFNRVKGIFSAAKISERTEQLTMMKQAIKSSRMLKLSADGTLVKRRVPFRREEHRNRSDVD